jgi:dihydrofolate reductase
MIAACAKNRVIGNGDQIPWHIPEDFKYFKEKTLGKPIIFGRTTFESIHKMKGTAPHCGPALPKRKNIIITRNNDYQADDCIIGASLDEAINAAKNYVDDTQEIMICGGGQIYKQALDGNLCDRMYITIIDQDYEGDVFFPQWDDAYWSLTSSDPRDGYRFNIYDRIKA